MEMSILTSRGVGVSLIMYYDQLKVTKGYVWFLSSVNLSLISLAFYYRSYPNLQRTMPKVGTNNN